MIHSCNHTSAPLCASCQEENHRETRKKYVDELENEVVWMRSIIDSITAILDGQEVSEFELSFPLVRRIADIKENGWNGLGHVVG